MAVDTSAINWFPGHMDTARKEIRKTMPGVDLVIEVLDARIPFSSGNPLVAELRGSRPCLQILNKADLADPAVTEAWLTWIGRRPGMLAFAHQHHQANLIPRLMAGVRSLVRPSKPRKVVAIILGIPNVGKSTLINTLSGRSIAKTANKPAVTRLQQRVEVGSDLALLDTPGFLWPRLEPPECGYRLAVTGAISDRILDYQTIAHFASRFLAERYPGVVGGFYGLVDHAMTEEALLDAIARRRGYLERGGGVDLQRAAARFIEDLRAGCFGRISFETPADHTAPPD